MTFLERIAESRLRRVDEARRFVPSASLRKRCARLAAARDPLARLAERSADRRAVIAEIKRQSPSKGPLRPDLDPVTVACSYERAGAFAVSVLTEPDHFGGSLRDLQAVREAVSIPILYKDFVVDPYQLLEARAHGADLVLLIVALLAKEIPEYVARAGALGLEPLVEVHGTAELEVALASGARLVGINNRDLKTFRVDLAVSRELLPRIPAGVFAVSESGLTGPAELDELARLGSSAFLVGEALITAPDPGEALKQFVNRGGS